MFRHELAKRGTLFTDVIVDSEHGVETSHGQGTLNILTGMYDDYKDRDNRIFGHELTGLLQISCGFLGRPFFFLKGQVVIC